MTRPAFSGLPLPERTPAGLRVVDLGRVQPLTDHVGIDAVTDGNAGNGCAGLQAFLDNLGFKRLGIRASLAHLRAIASASK